MTWQRLNTEDTISKNVWEQNVTRTDQANHVAFLRKKFMKRWPSAPLTTIEYYVEHALRPKKYYDRGRA
jgi:hypothetical protein